MIAVDQPVVDTDALPPTQYLILEVLAARYRTGETYWTFPDRVRVAANKLEAADLVWLRSSPAPYAFEARLTNAGRVAALCADYRTPLAAATARAEDAEDKHAELLRAVTVAYAELRRREHLREEDLDLLRDALNGEPR